jgi:NifB/MoaA-like Fe-S oxidoreductase
MVFAADEYYLMTGRGFPAPEAYEGFGMHEDGIGMARTFEQEFHGLVEQATGPQSGFFSAVDSVPPNPASYTALRSRTSTSTITLSPRRGAPIGILTGDFGARVIEPLVRTLGRRDVRVVPVRNDFFGGNTAVTGLMVGEDLARVLAHEPTGHRYLLPDVCINEGLFLDGTTVDALPRPVEIVATDGISLRAALEAGR